MPVNPAGRPVRSALKHAVACPSRTGIARLVGFTVGCLVLAVSTAACVPLESGDAGDAPLLHVANGLDGTISRIDSRTGRAVGAALPGGPAPRQIVVGPGGSLLVLQATLSQGLPLTYVARRGGAWAARPLSLEPGARQALLAGDGGRYALVAYHAPGATPGDDRPRCRLAVVDVTTGQVGSPRTVCAGSDQLVGLAMGRGAAGSGRDGANPGVMAYLAIWRRPAAGDDCAAPSGSRIVALRADTGTPAAVMAVDGVPSGLVLAPAPGRLGQRLYALEATIAAGWVLPDQCQHLSYDEHLTTASRWTALGLNAASLEVESRHDAGQPLRAFAVAPDGDGAYALDASRAVVSLDLTSGRMSHLATLPDAGRTLTVTADRVYVPNTYGAEVWALDRRDGHRLQTIATGRRPLGVTIGPT